MWTLMPSSAISTTDKFFRFDDLGRLTKSMHLPVPIIRGRVWAGDERNHSWAVECDSFEVFKSTVLELGDRVEFLAFDEMILDEDTLRVVQDDLYRYAAEETIASESISKGLSALRSHEKKMFAVVAYAFLTSGRVIFVRAQNELARFVYHPENLLTNEGLSNVRALKPLVEH